MDTEAIKQMAIDVNNVAAASFQSGKEHNERPLLAKIEQLQAENDRLKDALEHIIEYWNGSDNYKATTDALREIIETAEQALQGKEGSE